MTWLAQVVEAYCVPLNARGRTLGVLALGLHAASRRFEHDTLATATDLASRAAISLDNALLYRKIHEEDRRKNEFLAMLAHELRNPLAPISNAVHLLNVQEHDPSRLRWARDIIGRQLKQLVRLVDDLLDVSRITRGKIELKLDSIDVADVVASAVETSRPNVDALEHALTILLPPRDGAHARRLRPRVAGARQPHQQRGEVHAAWWPHLRVGRSRGQGARLPGA
jgi:signal transduction histidine kinase